MSIIYLGGLEPSTFDLEGRCSLHLSYKYKNMRVRIYTLHDYSIMNLVNTSIYSLAHLCNQPHFTLCVYLFRHRISNLSLLTFTS